MREPSQAREPQRFGTIIVISGGCYGSYYHRQLHRATRAGVVVADKLIVVDHDPHCAVAQLIAEPPEPPAIHTELRVADCHAFMRDYLDGASENPAMFSRDAIVPSPLMPHLIGEWIVDRARARSGDRVSLRPFERVPTVPWSRAGDDGTHYVSFATWMCPINCIEPRVCPHTKTDRSWSMPIAVRSYANDVAARGTLCDHAILECTHRAYGVGMIDTSHIIAADVRIGEAAARGPADFVIGTVSHCHGALTRLVIAEPAVDRFAPR